MAALAEGADGDKDGDGEEELKGLDLRKDVAAAGD